MLEVKFGPEKNKGLVYIEELYPLVRDFLDRENLYSVDNSSEEEDISDIRRSTNRRERGSLYKWGYTGVRIAVRDEEREKVLSLLRSEGYFAGDPEEKTHGRFYTCERDPH